jgi:hypothetical protein
MKWIESEARSKVTYDEVWNRKQCGKIMHGEGGSQRPSMQNEGV